MTCADARSIILSADPAALRHPTDPVLRAHLEHCAQCATAVSHVVGDLDRLRAALIARGAARIAPPVSRPRRSAKRVAMAVIPVALAAELALFAFLGAGDTLKPVAERPRIDDSVTSILPIVRGQTDSGEVVAAPAAVKATPVHVTKKPDSVAHRDTAVMDPVETPRPSLQVRAIGRQRYAVIGTSNPQINVVWLTKGDTL